MKNTCNVPPWVRDSSYYNINSVTALYLYEDRLTCWSKSAQKTGRGINRTNTRSKALTSSISSLLYLSSAWSNQCSLFSLFLHDFATACWKTIKKMRVPLTAGRSLLWEAHHFHYFIWGIGVSILIDRFSV